MSISHCRIQSTFTLFWQFHWKSLESSAATLSLGGVSHHSSANSLVYRCQQLPHDSGTKDVSELCQGKEGFHVPLCSSPMWSHIGCQSLSPVFPLFYSFTQYPPVSHWSNRPLISGGDSSCSWVFCSCTGPQFG